MRLRISIVLVSVLFAVNVYSQQISIESYLRHRCAEFFTDSSNTLYGLENFLYDKQSSLLLNHLGDTLNGEYKLRTNKGELFLSISHGRLHGQQLLSDSSSVLAICFFIDGLKNGCQTYHNEKIRMGVEETLITQYYHNFYWQDQFLGNVKTSILDHPIELSFLSQSDSSTLSAMFDEYGRIYALKVLDKKGLPIHAVNYYDNGRVQYMNAGQMKRPELIQYITDRACVDIYSYVNLLFVDVLLKGEHFMYSEEGEIIEHVIK